MIISTVDVISSTQAFIFGVGVVPLDSVKRAMFKFGNVSIVDISAARKIGCNKSVVLELAKTKGISARVSGGFSPGEGDIISWYRNPTVSNMVAIDVMLDGTVTMNGQQDLTNISFSEVFDKFKSHHIFLTFVDGQGKTIPYRIYKEWLDKYKFNKVTLAGGVSSAEDVAILHKKGIDVHVGAAIYRGDITLWSYLNTILDKDLEIFPMCVQDLDNKVLGILYTNRATLKMMCDTMKLTAYSRSRKCVWIKDERKGGVDVVSIRHNCNCDSLLVVVKDGKHDWCHDSRRSCFSI